MINIDTLGMVAPQVVDNLSGKLLANRIEEVAQRMKIPFNRLSIPNASSDSVTFIGKKIPAVTISAIGNGWAESLHSKNDQAANVNSASLYLGYLLALAVVTELDNHPCDSVRENRNSKQH